MPIKKVAFENDLYKIEKIPDEAGVEPDYFEQEIFSKLEGETAGIVKIIQESLVLPEKDSRSYVVLMEFLTLLFMKTPKFKHKTNRMLD